MAEPLTLREKVLAQLLTRAQRAKRRIVLAEGEDSRVQQAALRATSVGIADIILLGDGEKIATGLGAQLPEGGAITIINPSDSPLLPGFGDAYYQLRRSKGVSREQAAKAVVDPVRFAAMLVRQGHAEGSVAGAVASTAATIRAALQIIGPAPQVTTVSSFFLLLLPQALYLFADCGLVVEPDSEQLAEIASSAADSWRALIAQPPRIALLSFSSKGSARHPRVKHVQTATALLRQQRPELVVDGELQFDAAIIPEIAATKAPDSPLQGKANVLIFPNLEAANIGYKIAQRLGGGIALGPIVQGLAKPANDLSRGCDANEILHVIAITALQANAEL